MDLKQHIGLRVKAARTQAGLTQARLAEQVERAVETISNIERGQALPGLDLLGAIAEVTAAPLASFVEGFDRTRDVSPARLTLEEQIREATRPLTDRELALATRLLRAIKPAE